MTRSEMNGWLVPQAQTVYQFFSVFASKASAWKSDGSRLSRYAPATPVPTTAIFGRLKPPMLPVFRASFYVSPQP
ncbi:MAG TPA: hypothetical protein VJR06_00455 [Nitrososphaerales archaeon]|nr:hypothetical protein [Nitrososphaerales archaeon]